MFKANVNCIVTRMNGETDLYGQTQEGDSYETQVGIVRLEAGAQRTTVRTDASASRANAEERTVIARLMMKATDIVEPGDRISIMSFNLEVESVFPRHTVNGDLHHWQVDCKQWASK